MSATTSQPSAPRPDDKGTAPDERGGFLSRFTVLLHAPRELWLALTIKFLMFAAYGLTNSTIKLWLSYDFHYSDKQALALIGAWSLAITVVEKTEQAHVRVQIMGHSVCEFHTLLIHADDDDGTRRPLQFSNGRRTCSQQKMSSALAYKRNPPPCE